MTAGGALLMTHGAFPLWSFFVGGVAVYMGTIVLEGVSMSLTSKVHSHRLADDQGCDCQARWREHQDLAAERSLQSTARMPSSNGRTPSEDRTAALTSSLWRQHSSFCPPVAPK